MVPHHVLRKALRFLFREYLCMFLVFGGYCQAFGNFCGSNSHLFNEIAGRVKGLGFIYCAGNKSGVLCIVGSKNNW